MFQINLQMHVEVEFTAMMKHDARNTYGEMGRTCPAFSLSEMEGSH